MLSECSYAECRYAECRYAECRGALNLPIHVKLYIFFSKFLLLSLLQDFFR